MNIKNISPGVYLKPNIPTLNLLNTYILVFKKVKISSIFDRNLKIGTMKHILLFIMLTTITACLLTSCKSKTTQSARHNPKCHNPRFWKWTTYWPGPTV